MVLKFQTEVAEDDTISSIQNAIVDGKLGKLSVNVSNKIIGIAPVEQTTTAPPAGTTPKSEGLSLVVTDCGIINLRVALCCFQLSNLSLLNFQFSEKNNDIVTQLTGKTPQ